MGQIASRNDEPPLSAGPDSLLLGRDREGHWVVKDRAGLRGGIFVDRANALRYAMREVGNRIQSIVMVAGLLDIDFSRPAPALAHRTASRARRVA